jgi:hypothetical protein
VRENSFSDSLVEPSTEESSPGGASANSPALQRREKWKKWASPRGTTEVLTHTLQRWGEWKETFKSRRDDRVLALSTRLQLHAFSQTARKRLAFMRLNRRFAQPESPRPHNQISALPGRTRKMPHGCWRFSNRPPPIAQFPRHPPVHDLHSIEE